MNDPAFWDRLQFAFTITYLWKFEAATGKMRLVMRDFAGTGIAIDARGDLFVAMANMIQKVPAEELSH